MVKNVGNAFFGTQCKSVASLSMSTNMTGRWQMNTPWYIENVQK